MDRNYRNGNNRKPGAYPFIVALGVILLIGSAFTALLNIFFAIFMLTVCLCFIFVSKYSYNKDYNDLLNKSQNDMSHTLDEINNAIDMVSQNKPIPKNPDLNSELAQALDNIISLHSRWKTRESEHIKILDMIGMVTSNIEIEKLFESLMPNFVDILKSSWGAFYLANNATGKLELCSSIGFSKNIYNEFDLSIGEGFIGVAALSKDVIILKNIPENTVFITKTFLGKINPQSIMLVPVINNAQLIGILCLASIYDYTDEQIETVNQIKYYLGIALGNCIIYERSRRLAGELQFQNSLIQGLNEELESKIGERTLFFKNIIDSMTGYSIYVLDKDGLIIEWNKGAEQIYGYTADEVMGLHVGLIHSDQNTAQFNARMDNIKKSGYYHEKGWLCKKDGSKCYAEMSNFAMFNEHGDFIGVTNVTKNSTEFTAVNG